MSSYASALRASQRSGDPRPTQAYPPRKICPFQTPSDANVAQATLPGAPSKPPEPNVDKGDSPSSGRGAPKKYTGRVRGPKKGSRRRELDKKFWLRIIQLKLSTGVTRALSNKEFLESEISGKEVTGTQSEQVTFGEMLKRHLAGTLESFGRKRNRKSPNPELEKKLLQNIELRSKSYETGHCGLSSLILEQRLKTWAQNEPSEKYREFKASQGFIQRVLKNNNIVHVKLHGEANDITEEEANRLIAPFMKELADLITEFSVPPERIYNADQTGLFYNKLPNSLYV